MRRRLNLALNTVKRYARTREPEALRRAPRYRPSLVDPYREHLRARRAADPAVPVKQRFREIEEPGSTGSLNLLYRYITQGRAEGDRPVTTPRRLARLLLTRPGDLRDKDAKLLAELTASCPEKTALAQLVQEFAELLSPAPGNDASLTKWINDVRAAPTCPTCTPSPTGLTSTARPSMPASPRRTTTAAPKASTRGPRGS